ncbi:MAG: Hsp70 family protein [Actinomycetota bacterium]|nr:Hsp70 family protein [Actinomycetota bacterium]
MDGYTLGIDIGTTSSCAAIARLGRTEVVPLEERSATVPAAAYLDDDGHLLFGEQALAAGGSDPRRLIRDLKRHVGANEPIAVGDRSVRPDVALGGFLTWIASRVVNREGEPPDDVVVAHPAWWQERQMSTLRLAVERAELDRVSFVPEPVAVAAASLDDVADEGLVGVYDFGGGTFDATLLRRGPDGFTIVGRPHGGDPIGRIDLDQMLIFHVQTILSAHWPTGRRGPSHAAAMARLRADCTAAKVTLSTRKTATIPVDMPGLDEVVEITRAEMAQMFAPAIDHTLTLFSKMLADAGVAEDELDALVVAGGASRVPAIARAARGLAGRDTVVVRADADYAVCRGAAAGGQGMAPLDAARGPAREPEARAAAAPPPSPPVDEETPVAPLEDDDAAPAGRSRRLLLAALGAVVAVVALTAAVMLRPFGGDDDTTVGLASAALGDAAADSRVRTQVASAAGMVAVEVGTYEIGTDADDAAGIDVLAPSEVDVARFHIDETEVTNESWARFVSLHGAPVPVGWESARAPAGEGDHPVVGIDPMWAAAYCTALGKRLPTELEWEVAAHGGADAATPWELDGSASPLPATGTYAVGSLDATRGPTGTFDMVGNVWEWVARPGSPSSGSSPATGASSDGDQPWVRRGGTGTPVGPGWFTRQEVTAPIDLVVRASTGFRCAASTVDETAVPDVFVTDVTTPGPSSTDTTGGPGAAGGATVAAGVGLIDDDFEIADGAWPEGETDGLTTTYAPRSGYRARIDGAGDHVVVNEVGTADLSIATSARLVSHDGTPVRVGLAVRAHAHDPAATGTSGSVDDNYYAFSIDPLTGTWDVGHVDAVPYRSLRDQCTDPADDAVVAHEAHVLTATTLGNQLDLAIDGAPVCRLTMSAAHDAGAVGLYIGASADADAVVEFEWVEAVSR